jgi:CRP-like cAMP-binding protein
MGRKQKSAFNSTIFLSSTDDKSAILRYPKKKVLFSQGGPADAIFYVQKGLVKLTVISQHGREAVIGIFGGGRLLWRGVLGGATRAHVKCNGSY